MATKPFLVTILSRKTPFFGDETLSRRHFEPRNFTFWRRDSFSSSFFGRKTSSFGDEAHSRQQFEAKNSIF
ncbi:hypothetical protein [Caldifermentibacillus hisashii]|uniref:hypothetical protein n=1 Tax=Caldifermentibacillus hisashii TaxID=996558 RepID=UPI0031B732E4